MSSRYFVGKVASCIEKSPNHGVNLTANSVAIFERLCPAFKQVVFQCLVLRSVVGRWVRSLEPHPLRIWPTRADSSIQKRLFTVTAGSVTVYPPGAHWIRKRGNGGRW